MAKTKSFPFEASLATLERLVETMESGDLTLEDSLKAFQEGIELTRACQQALTDARQQVEILLASQGNIEAQTFEPDDDE